MQTFKKLPITIPKRKTNMYKTVVTAATDMILAPLYLIYQLNYQSDSTVSFAAVAPLT